MKRKLQIPVLICLMILSVGTLAKSQQGIYLSAADYTAHKLSYETGSIHLNNEVWNGRYVTVINNGEKMKLNKSDLYGYTDQDNKVHRFYKNEEYLIAEVGNITIYIQTEKVPEGKSYRAKNNYYFSTLPAGELIPLSIDNLKNAYRSNEKFLDLLDQFFANGDATAYDRVHNTYKVNYVFAKTLK